MGIPCPECGRQYDVTLFEYGRTIHCACGTRVGREIRSTRAPGSEPRFLCDTMTGKLARWLRAIGVDAAWAGEVEDEVVVRRALAEGRVIVTRDRRLPVEWRMPDVLVLENEDPLERLREVVDAYDLGWPRELFTRCLECNVPLEEVDLEVIADRLPTHVRETREEFRRCPACGRAYWRGSHTRRMRQRLAEALGRDESE